MRRKVSMRLSKSKQQQGLEQGDNKPPEISLPTLHHSSITFKDATETTQRKKRAQSKRGSVHPIRVEQQVRTRHLSKLEIQHEFEKLLELFDQDSSVISDPASPTQLFNPGERTSVRSSLGIVPQCEETCPSCKMIIESGSRIHNVPATPMRQSSRRYSLQCLDPEGDSPFAALCSPFKLPPLESDLDLFQEYMNSPSKRFHSPVSVQSEPYSFDFSISDDSRPSLPLQVVEKPQIRDLGITDRFRTESTSLDFSSSDITPTMSSSTDHTKTSQPSDKVATTPTTLPRLSSQRIIIEYESAVVI